MSKSPKTLLLIACLLAPWPLIADTLTFGVVPQQSASKLASLWSPIADDLGRRTGHDIRFATAPDIPAFERRLAAGEYDLAYMNPYHFVVFNEQPGYRAVAHASDKRIHGILVTRKDSGIENLAGGGVVRTFNNVAPESRDQLRVLWQTEGFTPHAIATHPAMPPATREALQAALIQMQGDEAGRELLKGIGIQGWQAATDSDWDDVRGLQLDLLQDLAPGR